MNSASPEIDIEALKVALKNMQPRHQLYQVIKTEMQRRGNWKASPRGIPMQKGEDPRRRK